MSNLERRCGYTGLLGLSGDAECRSSMAITFVERWWRVGTDVAVLVFLGLMTLFLELGSERGLYVERGFFCDDESLRFPYTIRPAVPTWLLVLGCFLIPHIAILVGNLYERYYKRRPECARKRVSSCCGRGSGCSLPPWALRALYHARWFLIGVLLTAVLTDVVKMTVGRLRPHFFAVCKPDFSQFNCTDQFGYPIYVTEYRCSGRSDIKDSDLVIHDAHLSFPSGHSSVSTYSFVFLALYLASVRAFYHRSALKLLLMLASLTLAILTSVSRLSDHRHHPTDVLVGMAIGTGVAVIVAYYFLSFFGHHKQSVNGENSSDTSPPPEIRH